MKQVMGEREAAARWLILRTRNRKSKHMRPNAARGGHPRLPAAGADHCHGW